MGRIDQAQRFEDTTNIAFKCLHSILPIKKEAEKHEVPL